MTKSKRWKPKEGEKYWRIINTLCEVSYSYNIGHRMDVAHYRLGNCFQTKKEAEAVARKLKGFWKDVREGRG